MRLRAGGWDNSLVPRAGARIVPNSHAEVFAMSIRVAIVEDDRAVRENLAALINAAPGFACVAACPSAEDALKRLPGALPDVVLMDIHLPGRSGMDCVARLRTLLPQTQVIMLTVEENAELVFESLKSGATGYLVKHVPPEEILEAVERVYRGGAPMSSHIARMVVTAFRKPAAGEGDGLRLTPREEDILRLLAKGHRSKEIADELSIGSGTVNTHIRHIYEKLHVRSRAEAVARFVQR
jgi:DNA-binding NarL/FixJ family response regulator